MVGVDTLSLLFMTGCGVFMPSEDHILPRTFTVAWGLWTLPGSVFHFLSGRDSVHSILALVIAINKDALNL